VNIEPKAHRNNCNNKKSTKKFQKISCTQSNNLNRYIRNYFSWTLQKFATKSIFLKNF